MHVDELPEASVAVHVRTIVPVALQPVSPARLSSYVTTGFGSQLSVTVGVPVLGGSDSIDVVTVTLPGHVITGGVDSVTVNVVVHMEKFPARSVTVMSTAWTPTDASEPASGDCVMVTVPHVSLAEVVAVKSGTGAWHEPVSGAVCGGAQLVMIGAVWSSTMNVVEHVELLLDASVAVMTIVCGPKPTIVPAGGDCVSVTLLQLSVATVVDVKSGTVAEHEAFAVAVCIGAHDVITGGVVSLTVNVVVHVEEFMCPSVAVIVTVCGPMPTAVPAVGDCVSVTLVQLSLADVVAVKSGTSA
jgi:hypothetical protein